MSAQMSNHVSQLRRQIDELKCHMNINRTLSFYDQENLLSFVKCSYEKVSAATNQLMQYVMDNEQRDYLVVKPPENPFKPKSSCPLL